MKNAVRSSQKSKWLCLSHSRSLSGLMLGAIVMLTACTSSAPKKLNTQFVENTVRSDFEKQTNSRVYSLKCPSEMLAILGSIYGCFALIAQSSDGLMPPPGSATHKLIISVKPTGKGTQFEVDISEALLLGKPIERQLQTGLKKQLPPDVPVAVTCPKEMLAQVGKVYECTVKVGNDSPRKAKLTPTTNKGAYKLDLPPAS